MKALGGTPTQNGGRDAGRARQTDAPDESAEGDANDAASPSRAQKARAGASGCALRPQPDESRANVLASVIERHEIISNRIKRRP